jgi:TRAP-type C4-dicarboxylate transport system substrate-binding protein
MVLIVFLILVAGLFIKAIVLIIMLTPIFLPLIRRLGRDPCAAINGSEHLELKRPALFPGVPPWPAPVFLHRYRRRGRKAVAALGRNSAMKPTLRSLFGIASAALGLVWATGASAQSAPVELRYATSAPPKTVWEMQILRFQKQVDEVSKGTLKINAFLNSQLGSEQDTVAQVARGRIDMGGYSVTAGSLLVPEISLLNIPFLFKDQKEQDCVLDKHLTKLTQDMFEKKGVVMLNWAEVGVADIIGKKAFVSPNDLKGLKARSAPNKVAAFMWSEFGANPNPLPVTEWNSAFQTGLIDVADSGPTYYFFSGLAKLAPVITMTQHQDQGSVVLMNKAVYDKLSDEHKKVLEAARTLVSDAQLRAEVRGFEAKIREMHKAAGGSIVELTPEQRAVWRKGIEAAWPKMVAVVGGEAPTYWKAIQDGIKACSP